ncbi:glycerophosphoryl diester phosphodiesterase membrane domain-containing protein [Qipengyuania flava]|uniref:glycerophosphoryl diester phosphodiesterase membrane domain-containing protein n=1 Tax=Qipengyuania flava TaxID=192812 RepID=UPI001C62F256|nr:glycerophosphoryl diester phosphodiesterase membrane domain-containing protein [Qipengyuania flava]QYJ07868.1 glycerophosphoryl diester phosphodiesterase membrane domain-containing protein [Qipengyuania flava]
MKFDLDTAWKDAMGLLTRNASLLGVVAGVFFFLPYAGIAIGIPEMKTLGEAQASGNLEVMMAAVEAVYGKYWYLFLAMAVIQGIGLLAMLALLRRRANPTVGEALGSGARSVVSYIAAQILQGFLIIGVAFFLTALFALTGVVAIAALGGVMAFVVACYLVTKLSLVAPVIGIEGERNPVAALRRSWALTKGNSMRLFLFYALLIVAFLVVSLLISLVLGLVFALAGEQAAALGEAVTSGLINAVMIVVMVCVMAAAHTQLARFEAKPARGEDLEA